MKTRYFNIARLADGTRAHLERDRTGRYIWTIGVRETILGCYETKKEARDDMRADDRFVAPQEE